MSEPRAEGLTPEEHRERHVTLHAALDELIADYVTHAGGRPSTTTVMELIEWSWEQSQRPTGEHARSLFSTADFSTPEGLRALKEHVDVLPRAVQDLLGRAIDEILRLHAKLDEARR